MKQIIKGGILFIIGGIAYCLIEALYRGYTHWSMFLLGAICFIAIGSINEHITWNMTIWKQMVIGSVIITILELMCGCIVNLWLGWDIWDYSNLPFNILGQICLPFSLIWFGISFFAILMDDYIRWKLFNEEKPHYRWQ